MVFERTGLPSTLAGLFERREIAGIAHCVKKRIASYRLPNRAIPKLVEKLLYRKVRDFPDPGIGDSDEIIGFAVGESRNNHDFLHLLPLADATD